MLPPFFESRSRDARWCGRGELNPHGLAATGS
jgi:hypothetical protein